MELITLPKLEEYKKFRGDDDWLARTPSYKSETTSKEWYLISTLIQDIKLVSRGLTSNEYSERLNRDLSKYCDSEVTIAEIKKLAEFL